ncbi:MAG: NADPH-dependent FMN reductase [Vicinamibacterales bacterium]
MRIAGIAGSLRQGSFNRALLAATRELKPEHMTIEVLEIGDVPFFNADVEAQGTPEPVARLREAIAAADGLLIATPEYNASVPGVLKNAIDWLSRPPGKSVLVGKPTALVGASTGTLGTARAQAHLRAALEHNAAPVMPYPQVFVAQAPSRFDEQAKLTDEKTRAFIGKFLEAFSDWVRRNGPQAAGR